jgi:hypothetical protein
VLDYRVIAASGGLVPGSKQTAVLLVEHLANVVQEASHSAVVFIHKVLERRENA